MPYNRTRRCARYLTRPCLQGRGALCLPRALSFGGPEGIALIRRQSLRDPPYQTLAPPLNAAPFPIPELLRSPIYEADKAAVKKNSRLGEARGTPGDAR